jgi:hypothetical protein
VQRSRFKVQGPSAESKLNNLCAHYKDTFDIHLRSIKQRDMLFYTLLIVAAFFSLQINSLEFVNGVITDYLAKETGIVVAKDSSLLSSIIWFLLFGASTKYFQVTVQIERQYDYLHALEKKLNLYYPATSIFTREGASYLHDYPIFSNWLWFIYMVALPVMLLLAISIRTQSEIFSATDIYPLIPSLICFFLTGTSTVLFLITLHQSCIRKQLKKLYKLCCTNDSFK